MRFEEGQIMSACSPEECDELFAQHLNAGNADGLLVLYEPQASHVRQDGMVRLGRPALRQVLEEFVAMQPKRTVKVTKSVSRYLEFRSKMFTP